MGCEPFVTFGAYAAVVQFEPFRPPVAKGPPDVLNGPFSGAAEHGPDGDRNHGSVGQAI